MLPDMVIMGHEKLIKPPDMDIRMSEKLIMSPATVIMTLFMCHVQAG